MKLKVGLFAEVKRAFTSEEVGIYCGYSEDVNPIHREKEASQKNGFDDILVPGLLVSSLFGGLMGSELPGTGTIHLFQDVSFSRPVYVNEIVLARIEVIKIRSDKPIVTFACIAKKNGTEEVVKGTAVVKVPKHFLA